VPSCSLAEILQESASSSGAKDVHQEVATYATVQKGDEDAAAATLPDCASTARSCSLGVSTLDSTEVDSTDWSALPSSVLGFLTERDTADCNAHALAYCVGTAPPSSIGVLTFVLVSAEKPKIASDPGKIAIRKEVPVEGTLIQAAATSSSMQSCSLGEVVTESGSSSGPKDMHQDALHLRQGKKVMIMRLLLLYLTVRAQLHHAALVRRPWT